MYHAYIYSVKIFKYKLNNAKFKDLKIKWQHIQHDKFKKKLNLIGIEHKWLHSCMTCTEHYIVRIQKNRDT